MTSTTSPLTESQHSANSHDKHLYDMHTHDHQQCESGLETETKSPLVRSQERFRDELFAAGILLPMKTAGLVGRSAVFERVVAGVVNAAVRAGAPFKATALAFPPVLPKRVIEKTDYLRSFPDMLGSVHAFTGNERDHMSILNAVEIAEDWAVGFSSSDAVLLPASCYPIYLWREGTQVPVSGEVFTVTGQCYRHEPSPDPARLRSFRQHEHVIIGSPEAAASFAAQWGDLTVSVLRSMHLPAERVVANDPFFGRMGKLLAASQVEQALKHEVVIPINSDEFPTACASVNQHHDHFTEPFDITLAGGGVAHTACVGFGLERIALALFKHHGFSVSAWPAVTRAVLGLL
jgi:seryl-tRNA synthetase